MAGFAAFAVAFAAAFANFLAVFSAAWSVTATAMSGVATIVSSVVDGFCLFFLFLGIGVSRSHFGQGEDCSQC